MNKTIHINLCGQSFTMDDNAYEELSAYISTLKKFYAAEEGLDEIITDIEARFAEVFTQTLEKGNRQIVSLADVKAVIAAMGRPEDFEGAQDAQAGPQAQPQGNTTGNSSGKRMYRDPDNKVVAGVSSGLAAYFGVGDPVWIRLLFILLAWFGGGGLLIYFILWFVVPEAKTASQKLEMKGEPVTLSNLERSVKEGAATAENNLRSFVQDNKTQGTLGKIVNLIGRVAGGILKLVLTIIKWFFIFMGGVLLISAGITLLCMLIATVLGMPIANLLFFEGAAQSTIAVIGLLLFLSPLLIILIYLPLRIFFKKKVQSNVPALSLLAAWIVGLILLIFASVDGASLMAKPYQTKQVYNMAKPDTLYLAMNPLSEPGDFENINFNDLKYLKEKGTWVMDNIELDVVENSDSQQVEIVQNHIARGKNRDNAKMYAQNIRYNIQMAGDTIRFDDVLSFGKPKKIRGQKVSITLKVPKNTYIVFGPDVENIVDDIPLSTYEGATEDETVYVMRNGVLYPTGSLEESALMNRMADTRDYDEVQVSEFNQVNASGNLSVKIVGGTVYKVFVHPAMKDEVSILDRDGELEIKRKKGNIVINKSKGSNTTYDCIIYTPELMAIKMSGNVKTDISGFKEGDLEASLAGISNLNVDGNFSTLKLDVAGKCEIKATGKCIDLQLNIAGISEYHGLQMESESADVNIAGASKAEVNARASLRGDVVGASKLIYAGTPNIEVNTNGASTIESAE